MQITKSGLQVTVRKFHPKRFWENKPILIINWSRLDKVAISHGRYFAATLTPDDPISIGGHGRPTNTRDQVMLPVKYKFYCKGNRLKCQSLLYLCQQHFRRHREEHQLVSDYRDWTLAGPVKPFTYNGDEPADKVVPDRTTSDCGKNDGFEKNGHLRMSSNMMINDVTDVSVTRPNVERLITCQLDKNVNNSTGRRASLSLVDNWSFSPQPPPTISSHSSSDDTPNTVRPEGE